MTAHGGVRGVHDVRTADRWDRVPPDLALSRTPGPLSHVPARTGRPALPVSVAGCAAETQKDGLTGSVVQAVVVDRADEGACSGDRETLGLVVGR